MTTAQQRRLYFPAWTAAAKNHGWHKLGGARPPGAPSRVEFFGTPELNALYQRICAIAHERASVPSPDDFRHACHIVAFGKDLSSSQLTNAQLDRILALFRLLADPDDLGATLAWNNPAEEKRKRMLWWLRHHVKEAYIVELSRERFGTDNWEALDHSDLHQLHMTLKNRPAAHRSVPTPNRNLNPNRNPPAAPDFVNVSRETEDQTANAPF